MKNNEIFEVLDRIAPYGPEPKGWAELAKKRNTQRRAATGVAAVTLAAVLVVPVMGQLLDRSIPTALSTPSPSPSTDDSTLLDELPEECKVFAGVPDAAARTIGDVVKGYYCFSPQEGFWHGMELANEELLPILQDIAAESEPGISEDMTAQAAHLYLMSDAAAALSVAQDVDGRFWWRQLDGTLMMWKPSGVSEARVEGTLTPVTRSDFAQDLQACWQETTFSTKPITDAASGVLCDPTGTTLETAEKKIPQELVQQIVEQASSTWVPVANDTRHGSGRSVILLDDEGDVFHLNQLIDGSMTWQQPDGSDLRWTPSGHVAEALSDLGMKYLNP